MFYLKKNFLYDIIKRLNIKRKYKEVRFLKNGIHPDYNDTTVTCACGNVIDTASTRKDIRVEICSKCHPFFTGKQKLVDTGGRVERFNKRFQRATSK